jgi:sec-independent protein translocase protein TatB
MAEILVIAVVALVFLGPDKLPKAARQVGKALRELRRHSDNVKAELRDVVDLDGVTQMHRDFKEAVDFRSVLTDVTVGGDGASSQPSASSQTLEADSGVEILDAATLDEGGSPRRLLPGSRPGQVPPPADEAPAAETPPSED